MIKSKAFNQHFKIQALNNITLVFKNGTCAKIKTLVAAKKVTPKISCSDNINLYNFYLNMIYFLVYYKYLVVAFKSWIKIS